MYSHRDHTKSSQNVLEYSHKDNVDANATSKRRLKSSSSLKGINSIDPYNLSLGKGTETVRAIKTVNGGLVGYEYQKSKSEIDEKFHRDYKDKLAEIETLKYQSEKLGNKYELTLQRVENLETENNMMIAKYEKMKTSYTQLKKHYSSIKANFRDAQDEDRENTRQLRSLEGRLDNLSQDKEELEFQNKHLATQVDKLYANLKEENRNYLDLELKYRLDSEKNQREIQELQKKLEDVRRTSQAEIDKLTHEKNEVTTEKAALVEEVNSVKDKYMKSLETINELKAENTQHTNTVNELRAENSLLKSEASKSRKYANSPSFKRGSVTARYEDTSNLSVDDPTEQSRHSYDSRERLESAYKGKPQREKVFLKEKIEALASESLHLTSEKNSLRHVLDTVQEELSDMKSTLQTERKEHNEEIEAFKETFEKRCELYQQEVINLKAKVCQLNEEKRSLLSDSDAAKFDFHYFESQMTKFQEIVYKLESEKEKLQSDLTNRKDNKDSKVSHGKQSHDYKSNGNIDKGNDNFRKSKNEVASSAEIKLNQAEHDQRERLSYSNSDVSEIYDKLGTRNFGREGKRDVQEDIDNKELNQALAEYMTRSRRASNGQIEDGSIDQSMIGHDIKEITTSCVTPINNSGFDFEMRPALMSATRELKRLNAKYNEIRAKYSF